MMAIFFIIDARNSIFMVILKKVSVKIFSKILNSKRFSSLASMGEKQCLSRKLVKAFSAKKYLRTVYLFQYTNTYHPYILYTLIAVRPYYGYVRKLDYYKSCLCLDCLPFV